MIKISKEDINFDSIWVVCKGVNLKINRESLRNYELQTGFSAFKWIESEYNNNLSVIRNEKINKILDE